MSGGAAAPSPPRIRSFLAFDYSARRVGIATGNTLLDHATPLTSIGVKGEARFAAIAELIAHWRPDELVVGVPSQPAGEPHDNTQRAQRFARRLQGRFKLPVHTVDERYTTAVARDAGAADVDATAAALILEQYLRSTA